MKPINGAESLISTLVASGVDVAFTNPGTSEMHFVAALGRVEGMRAILCLFEGVVTGMADGYGRMKRAPAATLLHLGPGLAYGLANLHNARRAATPIVNIVGDHATYHAQYDAPLTSDVIGFARPVSSWVHMSMSAKTVAADGARAVQAARVAPGQIATLILPADTAWDEGSGAASALPVAAAATVSPRAVDEAAQLLRNGKRTAILLRGSVLEEASLETAGRIKAQSGARIMCDTIVPRLTRGAGVVEVERVPYFAEQIVDYFKDIEQLILVGAKPPVSFFAYPGKASWCLPEGCKVHYLAHVHEDGPGALDALADALRAPSEPVGRVDLRRPELPQGPLNAYTIGQVIGHFLPDNAIVVDEAATSARGTLKFTAAASRHDHMGLTGGSLGMGIPVASGAAVACPDRKVVCLQGDGGAMYTVQALWTQARENLDVTTVIFNNRAYGILRVELERVGAENPGPKSLSLLDLTNPELDWVSLGRGLGVESSRATTAEELADQFQSAMKGRGPRLIEAVM
ncbi:acetolactate synthase large subunit [Sphingobium subterraneum]|nr:acetolactate synthase large subunit [Sphingobium subterraneum]